MIARLVVGIVIVVALSPVTEFGAAEDIVVHDGSVLAQSSATTEPVTPSPSPTASPSPESEDRGGLATGAGIVIAAILVGGLLLMRTKLLRR